MKSRRLTSRYRVNASVAHRAMGNMLKSGPFANHKVYQEYPVSRVDPSWRSGREKFDWVILDLKVVIEVHGAQHREPVGFGGMSLSEAQRRFEKQIISDKAKYNAAKNAGWAYIAIHDNEIKCMTLATLYKLVTHQVLQQRAITPKVVSIPCADVAKEFRKKRYQMIKQWAKKQKEKHNEN